MKAKRNVVIAGCGYVGSRLAEGLVRSGHTVWGIRRDSRRLPACVRPLPGDLSDRKRFPAIPGEIDTVFLMPSSEARTEAGYRRAYVDSASLLIAHLGTRPRKLERLFCISSTGVFEQQTGEWVDEESPATPQHFSGQYLLEYEALCRESSLPCTIVRFSGIYGPGRIQLLERLAQGLETTWEGPPLYTNRIHLDDCAGALQHLMGLESPAPLYLASDHDPVDRKELLDWMAGRLGCPAPESPPASAPGTAARFRTNKRCSNGLLLRHGYRFGFPSFRQGYEPIIRDYLRR